jgi:hypothetical protein
MITIESTKLKSPHLFKYKLTKKGLEKRVEFGLKKNGIVEDVILDEKDFEHLKENSAGFSHLIKERLIIVVDTDSDGEDKPSKLDKSIESLQTQKADQESKGKVFHHKAQAKLDKLLDEKTKTMQAE